MKTIKGRSPNSIRNNLGISFYYSALLFILYIAYKSYHLPNSSLWILSIITIIILFLLPIYFKVFKRWLMFLLLTLSFLLWGITTYLLSEYQYSKFINIEKHITLLELTQLMGKPDRKWSGGSYLFWGEEDTQIKNNGECISAYTYSSYDILFHPQGYVICFNDKNEVISKLVLRVEATHPNLRKLGLYLGLTPN